MLRRFCILILMAALPLSAAANREMLELQRDLSELRETVKALKASVEEKLATLGTQVQSSTAAASQANAAVAAVQHSMEQLLKEQESKMVPPMAALGARMDQVSNSVGTMQQAVTDLAAIMTKLQTQLGDLNNSVKVMQAPPAPPPVDAPAISATALITNASSDYHKGNLDLALQQYADYLKYYADTPQAIDAQYQIGFIHYSQTDYQKAVGDFDLLLKNYPENKNKVPEALFYKGSALVSLQRGAEAADVFKELRRRFPNHDMAKKSLNIKTTAAKQ